MENKDKLSEETPKKSQENDLDFDLSSFDLDETSLNTTGQDTDLADEVTGSDKDTQTQTKPKKKARKVLRAWLRMFLFVIIFTSILKMFFFEVYVIPHNNMGSTLKSTDYILVNKFTYGARLPKTLLHIPFTHQHIWGTDIPSYIEFFSISEENYTRFWGIEKPQKQDILIFGLPNDTLHPTDLKNHVVGRCVAVAGDTLRVIKGRVNVNNTNLKKINTTEQAFLLPNALALESSLASQDIDFVVSKKQIKAIASEDKIKAIAKKHKVKYTKIIAEEGTRNPNIIPKHNDFDWNEDNLGPLVIPKEGMKIPLSKHNVALYADIIINHDFLSSYEVKDGKLIMSKIVLKKDKLILQSKTLGKKSKIQEKVLKDYTFRQNYYFLLSDRRYATIDSRHFGVVPENHIIGKVDLVLLSYRGKKEWYNPLGWNRWFLKVK